MKEYRHKASRALLTEPAYSNVVSSGRGAPDEYELVEFPVAVAGEMSDTPVVPPEPVEELPVPTARRRPGRR